MTANRTWLLCSVLAACSSAAPAHEAPSSDAGDGAAASAEAASSCGPGNVSCGGVCIQQSVGACGAKCTVCGQPAASHGVADCVDGTCSHVCEIGYAACGMSGCCGGNTAGDAALIAVGSDFLSVGRQP